MTTTTWQPLVRTYDENDNGKLDPRERRTLPDNVFAFPAQRELPLVDAEHVREAIVEVKGITHVSAIERDQATVNIRAAAAHFDVEIPPGMLEHNHSRSGM